jgi:hypothetical protein
VRHVGEHDRTYVGWITRYGDIQVQSHDHETGETERATLHARLEEDDHDAPSIHVRPDGRLVVFYTEHSGPEIRYRIGTDPESVAGFGEEHVIAPSTDHTYPNPQHLGERGRTYLFYRNANRNLAYVASEDGCETWGEERELVSTTGWSGPEDAWVYFKIDGNGEDRIDVGLTHYEYARAPSPYRDVRFVAFDGETCRAADGERQGAVEEGPLPYRECPVVYDSSETGYFSWIWDCATYEAGPAVAYAELRGNDEHRYRRAWWRDGEWHDVEVTEGGHNIRPQRVGAYSGGIYLDHEDPGVCYVSTGDNDGSRIQRWSTSDAGRTWEVVDLTDDREQNVRPVVPRNRHDDLAVVWMRGRYDYYADREYDTALVSAGID